MVLVQACLCLLLLANFVAILLTRPRNKALAAALRNAADDFEAITTECELGLDDAATRSIVQHVAERGHHEALQAIEDAES